MASSAAAGTPGQSITLQRVVKAPRDRVWRAWTDAEELKRWFGPQGFTMPTCAMDLRPGGSFHYCLRAPAGQEMWGLWTFREVVAPSRLVLVQVFSDANRGVTRHPMAPTWPRQTLSTTTLTARGNETAIDITWSPHEATAEEQATFAAAHDGMRQGWAGTFAQLDAYLAKGG